ncbi:uncharacterized protein MONOS_17816 [Monocercomonoides exilis]|uniref:uncharacterized protein n=1 Tax=Monocercomonoides exilis TaxID=2049356 RepID=UPI00355AC597|nr:hypothetical protein MONOS_17816 [Monocercomonoides exilis]
MKISEAIRIYKDAISFIEESTRDASPEEKELANGKINYINKHCAQLLSEHSLQEPSNEKSDSQYSIDESEDQDTAILDDVTEEMQRENQDFSEPGESMKENTEDFENNFISGRIPKASKFKFLNKRYKIGHYFASAAKSVVNAVKEVNQEYKITETIANGAKKTVNTVGNGISKVIPLRERKNNTNKEL